MGGQWLSKCVTSAQLALSFLGPSHSSSFPMQILPPPQRSPRSKCHPTFPGWVTLDEHGQTQRRRKTLSVHITRLGKFLMSAVTISGPAGLCQLPNLKTSSAPRVLIPESQSSTWGHLHCWSLDQPSPGPTPGGWTPVVLGLWSQWAKSRRPQQLGGSSHCRRPRSGTQKIPASPREGDGDRLECPRDSILRL